MRFGSGIGVADIEEKGDDRIAACCIGFGKGGRSCRSSIGGAMPNVGVAYIMGFGTRIAIVYREVERDDGITSKGIGFYERWCVG